LFARGQYIFQQVVFDGDFNPSLNAWCSHMFPHGMCYQVLVFALFVFHRKG